jgi:hypothetical protein
MEAAQYAKQMMGSGPIGIGIAGAAPTPQRTLAQRLESAAQTISGQCVRIEDTLARINGTPRTNQAQGDSMKEATIRATAPLAQSVEAVEHLAKRICDLASTLEQVG